MAYKLLALFQILLLLWYCKMASGADCTTGSTCTQSDAQALVRGLDKGTVPLGLGDPNSILVGGVQDLEISFSQNSAVVCVFRHHNGINLLGSTHVKFSDVVRALDDIVSQCCTGQSNTCSGNNNIHGDQGDNVNVGLGDSCNLFSPVTNP